jgi:hypothetical protein
MGYGVAALDVIVSAADRSSTSAAPIVIIVFVAIAIGFGSAGHYIGRDKGRGTAGFWFGFLLGPIGLIIAALLQPSPAAGPLPAGPSHTHTVDAQRDTRPCPWCAERIKSAAIVCRYCGREVEPIGPAVPYIPSAEVEYDLSGWTVENRAALVQRLDSADIRWSLDGDALLVHPDDEQVVDDLMEELGASLAD